MSVRGCDRASAVNEAAFRADRPDLRGQRSHQIELEFQRGVGLALGESGVDGTGDRRIEKCRGKPAVNGAHRVVMPKFRHTLEYGAAILRFDEPEPERLRDRRLRQEPVDDGPEEAKAIMGEEDVAGHDAGRKGLIRHRDLRLQLLKPSIMPSLRSS